MPFGNTGLLVGHPEPSHQSVERFLLSGRTRELYPYAVRDAGWDLPAPGYRRAEASRLAFGRSRNANPDGRSRLEALGRQELRAARAEVDQWLRVAVVRSGS